MNCLSGPLTRSIMRCLLGILLWLPAGLGGSGCDQDPGSEAPPRLSIALRLPAGKMLSDWNVTRLKITASGGGLEQASTTELTVNGDEANLGVLPEIPFSNKDLKVLVEGLDEEDELRLRGVSMPVKILPETLAPIHIFLTGVDSFVAGQAFEEDGEGSATMNYPRVGHSVTLFSNPPRVMVTGGVRLTPGETELAEGEILDSIEFYDPEDGRWHLSQTKLVLPRAFHTATLLSGLSQKVLVSGGLYKSDGKLSSIKPAEILVPDPDNVGDVTHQLNEARQPEIYLLHQHRAFHTATLGNEWVLIAGGESWDGKNNTKSVLQHMELFLVSPSQELVDGGYCGNKASWAFCHTPVMFLKEKRTLHGATDLSSVMVFLFGGNNGTEPSDTSEFFIYKKDGLPTGTKRGPTLNQARSNMTWVKYQETAGGQTHLFVFGGIGPNNRALASIEWYNPEPDTFALLDRTLTTPRADAAAVLLGEQDGWVLVTGGLGDDRSAPLGTADRFQLGATGLQADPEQVDSMVNARYGHRMVRMLNGMVMVTGGMGCSANDECSSLKQAEFFNPHPEFLD